VRVNRKLTGSRNLKLTEKREISSSEKKGRKSLHTLMGYRDDKDAVVEKHIL
jgi:hypothetical protein